MYRDHAERLSRIGLGMLIYDKRGTGRSTGDWRQATFADIAGDALGAAAVLKKHPSVDPKKIGFFGSSQGGWIALLAASKDPEIAFIVTLSGPTTTPAEQGHYITEAALRKKGYSESDVDEALKLARDIAEVYRTNTGWEEAKLAVEKAREKPWFDDAQVGIQTPDSWNWKWYRDLPFDFDPLPFLGALEIPLFSAHGEDDALVPAARSAETIESLKKRGKDFTVVVFPDARHGLDVGEGRLWQAPAEYWAALEDWLRAKSIIR